MSKPERGHEWRPGPMGGTKPVRWPTPASRARTHSSTSAARAAGGALAPGEPAAGRAGDVNVILPFEEVVEALGRKGEQQPRPPDDRARLDRRAPWTAGASSTAASGPPRAACATRWERIAAAQRRGESMPPIDVYRIGELHFVKDGHHRVSVARALGRDQIDAYVTDVITRVGADRKITLADLPLKSHERLFYERVPLPEEARGRIQPQGPARLRVPGGGRGGLGLPGDAGARASSWTASRSRAPGSQRSTSRWSRCCARPAWPPRPRRPTPTWRRSPCATCC